MKHGIYYAYWEKEWAADYTYYVDKVARLGFDILEVGAAPLPDYTPEQIRALRDCVKANGIELTAGYGPTYDHNLGSSDPAIRKNAKEWFTRLFDVMAQLDIHLIGGALYSYWPLDFSKGVDKEGDWKRSVEAMQDIAPVAAQYGINMGMEVLNRFENHILNTAEEGVAFVKEVGMDNIKVMLDTFHMNIEESSIGDAIRTYANHGREDDEEPGNVWLDKRYTTPYKFYQFWLNVSDEEAERYIKIFTSLGREEIDALVAEHRADPGLRLLQKRLGEEVTCMVHSRADYETALEASGILFGKATKESLVKLDEATLLGVFEGVPQFEATRDQALGQKAVDLFAGTTQCFASKGEMRKLVQGGGVSLNKEKLASPDRIIESADLLAGKYLLVQRGKKNYFLIIVKA